MPFEVKWEISGFTMTPATGSASCRIEIIVYVTRQKIVQKSEIELTHLSGKVDNL